MRIAAAALLFAALVFTVWWAWSGDQQPGVSNPPLVVEVVHGEPEQIDEARTHSTDQLTRDSVAKTLRATVQSAEGSPVNARIRLIRRDNRLDLFLAEGTRLGRRLWGDHLVAEYSSLDGELTLEIAGSFSNDELALLADAPGFAPACIPVKTTEPLAFVLHPIKPVQVRVISPDQQPVANAQCWLRGTLPEELLSGSWTEALQHLGVVAYAETDHMGMATLSTCLPTPTNTLQVTPPPGLAAGSYLFVAPGTEIEVVCVASFSVRGTVHDDVSGKPIGSAAVLASVHDTSGARAVATTLTENDGSFRFEDLPTGVPTIWIRAQAEGYAPEEQILLSPSPGAHHDLDISLKPAAGAEIRVLTSWGDPIPNVQLFLRKSRLGEATIDFVSNEDGRITIPPLLAQGTPYQAVMTIGGFYALGPEPVFAGGSVEEIIPRLTIVEKVTLPKELPENLKPIRLGWESVQEARSGVVSWSVGQAPPILPSGPGVWRLQTASGFIQVPDNLPEGTVEEVTLPLQPASLSMTFPEGGAKSVKLTGLFDEVLADFKNVPEGPLEIKTVAGVYQLYVEGPESYRTFYHVEVPASGRDLGPIAFGEFSWISGTVSMQDGTPLADFSVDVMGVGGAAGWTFTTDENGYFETSGLAPGTYLLVVTGDQTYGMHAVETTAEVFLSASQHIGPLEFHPLIEGEALVVEHPTPVPDAALCWLFGPSLNSTLSMPPNGMTRFPVPQYSAWLGMAWLREGYILFGGSEIGPGTKKALLSPPKRSHDIQIVSDDGKPRADFNVLIFVNGVPLPYAAFPDAEGRFHLEVDPELPCNIQFREPNGRATVVSLQDLLALSTFVLPLAPPELTLTIQDSEGRPVPHAVAMRYGVGDVYQADGYGKIQAPVPDEAHPIYVRAPGFIGQWASGNSDETLTLAWVIFDATLSFAADDDLAARAASVKITPLDQGQRSAFPEFVEASVFKRSVSLPPLPDGQLRITLLDADGSPLAEQDFVLREDGQALHWD